MLFFPQLVLEDLMYITGNGNYSQITMTNGQKYLSSRNLSFYEEHFSKCCDSFLRVHKQCLINVHLVKKCALNQLMMMDGYIIPIARRRKKAVHVKMRDLALQHR